MIPGDDIDELGDDMGMTGDVRFVANERMPMRRDPFDWLTKFVVPLLALLGTITSLLKDQRQIAMLLAAVVLLSMAISLVPLMSRKMRDWRAIRRYDRAAKVTWPELTRLVETFGTFIGQSRSDSVHGLLGQFSNPHFVAISQLVRQYDFVPAPVFYGPWKQVSDGVNGGIKNHLQIQRIIELFTWLVVTYESYVIHPLFSRVNVQVQQHLTAELKPELEMCRGKLTRFLDDYEALLARLAAECPGGPFGPQVFRRIPPL